MSRFHLHHGDNRLILPTIPDASIDAIVTDPPYELGFMGKTWDASGIAYDVDMWRECLRVLKPGGHILAFGGSRTYHRLACAIEDAGFEIRDQIMWVYGSGFPKSLDVSKAIDKMDAAEEQQARRYRFTAWVRSTGVTAKQIDQATATNMGGHYTTNASQPAIMTREHLEACRHLLGNIPEWVEREADIRSVESQNFASREVVGTKTAGIANKEEGPRHTIGAGKAVEVAVTAPATDAAKRWEGWGTALKPAHEPIVLARKPLNGTVANNVLQHGTGALNIDACRVHRQDGDDSHAGHRTATFGTQETLSGGDGSGGWSQNDAGRWPANLIHDGSDEVIEMFPETTSGAHTRSSEWKDSSTRTASSFVRGMAGKKRTYRSEPSSGSAARFFYCAKANKRDRNEGLDNFQPKRDADRIADDGVGGNNPRNRTNTPKLNHHPTVKPTELMRYLCRLITPPGGTILDPFTGSGSTGKAAVLEGFRFVGIEQDADYVIIAEARIRHAEER